MKRKDFRVDSFPSELNFSSGISGILDNHHKGICEYQENISGDLMFSISTLS